MPTQDSGSAARPLPPRPILPAAGQAIAGLGQLEIVDRAHKATAEAPGGAAEQAKGQEPEGFLRTLLAMAKDNITGLPRQAAAKAVWLVPVALSWVVIASTPGHVLYNMPAVLASLVSLVGWLTATYNGVIGKAIYAIALGNTVVPLVKQLREQGVGAAISDRTGKYTRALGLVKQAYANLGDGAIRILLASGGLGLMLANVINRNNSPDKYLASLLAGLMLYTAMTEGLRNPIVRLFRAGWRDLRKLTGQGSGGGAAAPGVNQVYAAMAAMAGGLAGSLIICYVKFTREYYDYTGYIIGGVMIAASLVLPAKGKLNVRRTPET